MGGRGTISPLGEDIGFFESTEGNAKGIDLHVAPYNPQSGHKEVDAGKSLAHIETAMEGLDHEQMFIMDGEGYVVAAVDGGKGSVAYTAKALASSRGNVATHNHPRKGRGESGVDGGTFSMDDIYSLRVGMKELRAVGNEGTYSMKATGTASPEGLHQALLNDKAVIVRSQREIAGQVEMAYERGRYQTKHDAKVDSVNRQMQVIHHWYETNAGKYGYSYSFTPEGQREAVAITPPKRRTQKEIDRDNRGIYYGKRKAAEQKQKGMASVNRETLLISMGYKKQPDGSFKHPKTGQVVKLFQMPRS